MKKINEYEFVDCIMVDFNVDKLLSTLSIIAESYYPLILDGTRKKGLLQVAFKDIYQLHVTKNEEFNYDILLPYDYDGNDVKANEIYSMEISNLQNGICKASIKSDMLNIELECKNYDIVELG